MGSVLCTVKFFMNDTFCHSAIKEMELPDSLEAIGYDTFICCTSLKRLVIPSHVKEIGPWLVQAHEGFEGLNCLSPYFRIENDSLISNTNHELIACWSHAREYHIPPSVKKIGSICNDMVETVVIAPTGVEIGQDAFISCKQLKRIIQK